jgi:hypothetical protein
MRPAIHELTARVSPRKAGRAHRYFRGRIHVASTASVVPAIRAAWSAESSASFLAIVLAKAQIGNIELIRQVNPSRLGAAVLVAEQVFALPRLSRDSAVGERRGF